MKMSFLDYPRPHVNDDDDHNYEACEEGLVSIYSNAILIVFNLIYIEIIIHREQLMQSVIGTCWSIDDEYFNCFDGMKIFKL